MNSIPSASSKPRIAVLMCTFNGGRFLLEQLESIKAQTHENLSLWISDDGSNDSTLEIIQNFKLGFGADRCHVLKGPGEGYAKNFLSLICHSDIEADYFAYSDQDDIWSSNKLERAVTTLSKNGDTELPALYLGRTHLIDAEGNDAGFSPHFRKKPCFQNALVQSIGGGNTMVMNKTARNILKSIGTIQVVSHDWWTYLLISGVGGRVFYDATPTVLYRQHGTNLVGSNISWISRLDRIGMLLKGRFRNWNSMNIAALGSLENRLTADNLKTLKLFTAAREASLFSRSLGVFKSGVYRQTLLGNLGLAAATLLKKF